MTSSKRHRNIILLFLLTIISASSLQAQSFNGKIISSQGGEPVPFANVMIKGTTIGMASGIDGQFAITIPSEYKTGTIIISAVGFTNKEMPASELKSNKENIIVIKTQEYNIDEVDVQAESKVLYGAVKKCSKNIASNYISEPYTCDFSYFNNGKKAEGVLADQTGYQRSTFKESFDKIGYYFLPNNKETSNSPFFQGKTNMEDLLSFDIVRTVGNVIDEQNVYDFDLSLTPHTNDKIWVIHFVAKNPKLYNTGEAHILSYEGELYILKDNFAITKVVIRGHADKRSIHGKSIAVTNKSSNYISDLSYEVVASYQQDGNKYRLDNIEMSENFTTQSGQKKSLNSSLIMGSIKPEFKAIKGRDYYVKDWQ